MKSKYLQTQLMIISAVVLTISSLLMLDFVFASPTLNPPDGNITIPPALQGAKGPTGPGGNTGNQGPQGYTGATGPAGDAGYAYCNFPGYGIYVSHGWDGACAWQTGMSMSCWSNARTGVFQRHGGSWPCIWVQ